MPHYDVRCSVCGDAEVFAKMRAPLSCPSCGGAVEQVFLAPPMRARIDDAENIGSERTDSTRGVNLGLPGVTKIVGTHPDGRPKTEYRPISSSELPSNRALREYAKRNNCTPLDGGRFRSTS